MTLTHANTHESGGSEEINLAGLSYAVPSGGIIMWHGTIATIPTGWVLCDGTNSTPDLRDLFIVGARQDLAGKALTNITGALTQTGGAIAYTPAGTVNVVIANHLTTNTSAASAGAQGSGATLNTLTQAAHTHTYTPSPHVISSQTFTGTGANIVMPYFALAYIMKT